MTDPLDRAVAGFRELPVPARPPDAAVLARLTAAEPAFPLWRRVVKRTVLFAVAAAVLVGLGLLLATPSVALADVPKAAEKHKLLKYKATFRLEGRKGRDDWEHAVVAYADMNVPRHRYEDRQVVLNDTIEFRVVTVTDWTADRTLSRSDGNLMPGKTIDANLRAVLGPEFGPEFDNPPRRVATLSRAMSLHDEPEDEQRKPFLTRLRDLAAHPKAVTSKALNFGTATTKFRIEDGPKTIEVWVDATTHLPERMQYELLKAMKGETIKWTYHEFEWDPKLPDGVKSLDELFSTAPPAGYKLTDNTAKP